MNFCIKIIILNLHISNIAKNVRKTLILQELIKFLKIHQVKAEKTIFNFVSNLLHLQIKVK